MEIYPYLRTKKWSRREFLKSSSAAALGTLLCGAPRPALARVDTSKASADSVILLWMAGGMAHTETFDPKPHVDFKRGLHYKAIRSTFPSIPTSVDGLKISSGLENIAEVMDRLTLVRSFQPPDLGHILHSRHQFHWHTGYMPPQTVEGPHIGAMIARTLGPLNPEMPPFIHIGQRLDIDGSPEVKAFLTGGFLGRDYGPFLIPFPEQAGRIMSPPEGMTPSRFENRRDFYKKLLNDSPVGEFGSDFQKESYIRAFERSHELLQSDAAKAFDISLEPKEVQQQYDTGRFGRGCLLARRLREQGARFIEVTTEHVPFGNWDTHVDGHTRTVEMKESIDRPVSQLLLDLEERGLLDRTLVVLASEFSRATLRDPKSIKVASPQYFVGKRSQFGLHKHFTKAGAMLLAGGGAKQGHVHGETADIVPCETVSNPVTLENFHATIYAALGVPPDYYYEIEKRPYYVTKDGLGKPIWELLKQKTLVSV